MKDRVFVLYVACNMLLCALLFLPWAKPRETVSGLLGRWLSTGNRWQCGIAQILQWIPNLMWGDRMHCLEVYGQEREARATLYGPIG